MAMKFGTKWAIARPP